MPQTQFTSTQLPDLSGATIIVTGASSGLGAETARALAGAGAHVVMAVRDTARGQGVADGISGATEVRRLDLADLSSIRAFAAEWVGPLDILINNAGIMAVPEARTADGFEAQIGTNHLGHFALTLALLPNLSDRVVTLTSDLSKQGEIVLDDLNWERRPYKAFGAYNQSKLANLLFTYELQRRLTDAGSPLRAYSAHPGVAGTGLQNTGSRLRDFALTPVRWLAQDAAHGALPTLYAATQELAGGSCVGPDGRMGVRHSPRVQALAPTATDPTTARALWNLSARLTHTDSALEIDVPAG